VPDISRTCATSAARHGRSTLPLGRPACPGRRYGLCRLGPLRSGRTKQDETRWHEPAIVIVCSYTRDSGVQLHTKFRSSSPGAGCSGRAGVAGRDLGQLWICLPDQCPHCGDLGRQVECTAAAPQRVKCLDSVRNALQRELLGRIHGRSLAGPRCPPGRFGEAVIHNLVACCCGRELWIMRRKFPPNFFFHTARGTRMPS
jgi:hypothetical protein